MARAKLVRITVPRNILPSEARESHRARLFVGRIQPATNLTGAAAGLTRPLARSEDSEPAPEGGNVASASVATALIGSPAADGADGAILRVNGNLRHISVVLGWLSISSALRHTRIVGGLLSIDGSVVRRDWSRRGAASQRR